MRKGGFCFSHVSATEREGAKKALYLAMAAVNKPGLHMPGVNQPGRKDGVPREGTGGLNSRVEGRLLATTASSKAKVSAVPAVVAETAYPRAKKKKARKKGKKKKKVRTKVRI